MPSVTRSRKLSRKSVPADLTKFPDKVYVYLSGPLTAGDLMVNTSKAIEIADILMSFGFIVFNPHLSVLGNIAKPRSYESWMTQDLAWVERCDFIFRMDGKSPGGDREVEHGKKRGIPTFFDKLTPEAVCWNPSTYKWELAKQLHYFVKRHLCSKSSSRISSRSKRVLSVIRSTARA